MASRRSWLPILILTVVASACSGADDTSGTSVAAATTTVTAAVTTTATSAPAASTTTSAAASSTTIATPVNPDGEAVTFPTDDGLTLEGRRFGSGPTLVVLAHMRPATMDSWFEFARVLAAEGYSALAFNFRGYGNSEGDGFDVETDVVAAIDFATGLDAQEVFAIGASMGGTGAVTASSQRPVGGTITLSAPDVFEGADAVTAAPSLTAPILLVAAENDTPYPSDAATIDAAATAPSEVVILSGSAHGTNLFADHGDDLTALILGFLAENG